MSNPMLNENKYVETMVLDGEPMTIQGTVGKMFLLFVCLLAGCGVGIHYLMLNIYNKCHYLIIQFSKSNNQSKKYYLSKLKSFT